MAATKTRNYLLGLAKRSLADFDPNATAATIVDFVKTGSTEMIAIEDAEAFVFGVVHTVGTTDVLVEVIAATDADGTGATQVTTSSASDIDAVNDEYWVEVDVAMIREVLATATHVGLRITLTTATDECSCYYEKWGRFQYRAQTVTYVS